jgi:anti-anti-sigma factor
VCARLHSDRLQLSSAGHPATLIIRRDGRIREIGGGGPILGLTSNAVWPERTVRVGRDETVVLYTDGVTETRGAFERFGLRRLRALLVEHAADEPAGLLAEIEQAVERFQIGPQGDDTAALALRLEQPAVISPTRAPAHRPTVAGGHGVSSPALEIVTATSGGRQTIRAAGEIDNTTAAGLLDAFAELSGAPGSELALDLAAVTFVDSVGLRTIVELEQRARDRGMSMQVVSAPQHVRAVFRLSGVEGDTQFAGPAVNGSPELDYAERVELELPVDEHAPRRARAEVREAIGGKLSQSDAEVAVLLASELVTNAFLHSARSAHRDSDTIGLRINSDIGRARVEVADSGRGFDPAAVKAAGKAIGGLGLRAVDRGAARWGISRDERFRVWFELC